MQPKLFNSSHLHCKLLNAIFNKKLVIQHVARWHTFHTMVFVKTFHVFASTLLKIRDGKYAPFDILLYNIECIAFNRISIFSYITVIINALQSFHDARKFNNHLQTKSK